MTTNNPVKATDSNIISLKNLEWCISNGYYFDPLTDQVYSSIAQKHSVNDLFPLTAEISNNGSKAFKLRGVRFSVEQIHDGLSNNVDPKLRAAYKKIMASKSNPVHTEPETNSEKWVKVTDWRTLKVGDIIKTDDPDFRQFKSCTVSYLEPFEYTGSFSTRVNERGERATQWVSFKFPLYKLETSHSPSPKPQPSKGWVIMHQNEYGLTPIDWQGQTSFAKIYQSESEADAKLKDLCNADMGSIFVKLEIKNFAITKTNPEFQLT